MMEAYVSVSESGSHHERPSGRTAVPNRVSFWHYYGKGGRSSKRLVSVTSSLRTCLLSRLALRQTMLPTWVVRRHAWSETDSTGTHRPPTR